MRPKTIKPETYKALKEIGYEWGDNCTCGGFPECICDKNDKLPLQITVQMWFREKYGWEVYVAPWKDHAADVNDPIEYVWRVFKLKTCSIPMKCPYEATETAINEAIELMKNRS